MNSPFHNKEDGSLLELSNWRPVTLLNVDCKIATKAIAKRIEPLFPNLVHTDQTSFIKVIPSKKKEYLKFSKTWFSW